MVVRSCAKRNGEEKKNISRISNVLIVWFFSGKNNIYRQSDPIIMPLYVLKC
jgi:hypothetical protein